jgi:hypothetical protein
MNTKPFFNNLDQSYVVWLGEIFGEDVRDNFAVVAEAMLNSELGKIVWPLVEDRQQLLDCAPGGVEKHHVVFPQIVDAATAAGLAFNDSIIDLLIELCVQKRKGNA